MGQTTCWLGLYSKIRTIRLWAFKNPLFSLLLLLTIKGSWQMNRLVWGSRFSDQALVRTVSNDIVQWGRLLTGRNYSAWLAVTIAHPSLDFSNKLLSEMLAQRLKEGQHHKISDWTTSVITLLQNLTLLIMWTNSQSNM